MLKHKQKKSGFTLVEVALFLAVTGVLFVGIAVGVQNSIYQQRFNDSVQNYVEFLRTIYSGVSNVENNYGAGNSNKAIYGKLVQFGATEEGKNLISVYTVIGDIEETDDENKNDSVIERLEKLGASVVDEESKYAGIVEEYSPRWSAQIQKPDGNVFTGSLLIARNPESGTIYTFLSNTEVDEKNLAEQLGNFNNNSDADFCIIPEGVNDLNARRNVRIVKNARNSSGIEVISDDSDNNVCRNN